MKIFDIVDAVITNIDDVRNGLKKIDSEKFDILREYCDVIDTILSDYDGSKSSVSVDPDTNYVTISIEVVVFSANRFNQSYFDIIERSISLTVSNANNGNVEMEFVFPSVFV